MIINLPFRAGHVIIAEKAVEIMILKRKIYDKLVEWKKESNGSTALLIGGARRVGSSGDKRFIRLRHGRFGAVFPKTFALLFGAIV